MNNSFNNDRYNNRPAYENKRTEVKTFFSDTGMLNMTAIGESLAFKYFPPIAADDPNGTGRRFNMQMSVSIMFRIDNINGIATILTKDFTPIVMNVAKGEKLEKPLSVVVSNSSGNALKVEYKPDENNVPYGYISVIKGINPETMEPAEDGSVYTIKLEKQKLKISDDKIIEFDNQLLYFIKKLEALTYSMGSVPHAVEYSAAKSRYYANSFNNKNMNGYSNNGYSNDLQNNANYDQTSNYGGFSYPANQNNNQSMSNTSIAQTTPDMDDDLPF